MADVPQSARAGPASESGASGPDTVPLSIKERYKRTFLKGLATILPTVLTVYILLATWNFLESNIATPLNAAIQAQLKATFAGREAAQRFLDLDPELLRPGHDREFAEAVDRAFPSWIGIAAAVVLCFVVGFFIASFVGRRLFSALERGITRLPIVKAIYPSAKQITDFLIKHEEPSTRQFGRVVFVPFPTSDQWTIGFLMSEGFRDVDAKLGKRFLNVFIPWSPTPVTGFVILVPEEHCHPLNISVDEALKFYVTAGLVVPERQLPGRPTAETGRAPTNPRTGG